MMSAMKNTSIIISDELGAFIEREVASGRYASASEVVRDSLRLLERRALEREQLRTAILAGEESGPAEPFDMDEFLTELRGEAPKRA
ncbi:type II toxin-antitoxin system ParD family antitoxin [Marinicauda salina]|uniref:Type II toxin-antitoxin system ParD family antitoxin n=1 Tax=Marinicauda salina TaxID=2135793 RepID=A0A2U2BTM2_9PROT|nr:type II toxin-antitoxin system ParD family antitoxin [Marinicauda salina]PWE17354.1 type II toxin-antitoxin system ParD family antitoxin [Marinicauda salina]